MAILLSIVMILLPLLAIFVAFTVVLLLCRERMLLFAGGIELIQPWNAKKESCLFVANLGRET